LILLQIVVAIYIAALVSQSSRFVEFDFVPFNVTSRVDPAAYVTGCRYSLTSFIDQYEQVGDLCDLYHDTDARTPTRTYRGLEVAQSYKKEVTDERNEHKQCQ